jgi:hypothetical protein
MIARAYVEQVARPRAVLWGRWGPSIHLRAHHATCLKQVTGLAIGRDA